MTEPDPSPPVAETLARLQLTLKARQASIAHALITRARINARDYPSEATLPPRISRKKGNKHNGINTKAKESSQGPNEREVGEVRP